MSIRPADLNVVRTPIAAEMTAAALWDMVSAYEQRAAETGTTALVSGAARLVRSHIRQLIELHDELKADEILLDVRTPARGGENVDGFA